MSYDYGILNRMPKHSKFAGQPKQHKFSNQTDARGRENLIFKNYSSDRLTTRQDESTSGDSRTQGSKISFNDKFNYYKDILSSFQNRKNKSVSCSRNSQTSREVTPQAAPNTHISLHIKGRNMCSNIYISATFDQKPEKSKHKPKIVEGKKLVHPKPKVVPKITEKMREIRIDQPREPVQHSRNVVTKIDSGNKI